MQLGFIGPIQDRRRLSEYSLVLRSMAIEHGLSSRSDGFYFSVAAGDVDRTRDALRTYDEENKDFAPRRHVREQLAYPEATVAAPLAMGLLAAFFAFVTGPLARGSVLFARGTSDDRLVLHGHVHRAVTALTLHADAAHLVGNAAAGAVFLTLLVRRAGPGRGLFLALLAGTLGNLLNTVFHVFALHQPHRSLGASTAVFAIVGLLAASQFAQNRVAGVRRWTDRVGPVVGGLALLGMLGASPHTDVWAHVWGFVAGAGVGLVALRKPGATSKLVQGFFGTLTVLSVAGAWTVAAFVR